MVKIGVISDTHGYLNDKIIDFLEPCNEIWHAGDIGHIEILERLEKWKPLRAVFGNIDGHQIRSALSEVQLFTCGTKKIMITHIAGYPGKYQANVRQMLEENPVDIFVCGHSHILKVQFDNTYKHLHINPGAAGKYGLHKFCTAIRFEISGTKISNMEILELPR
jgi:uncharacterized protein